MKLFDDLDYYTDIALDIAQKVEAALEEIFKSYAQKGYSKREIAYIMHAAITDLELSLILTNPKRKEEK